jgi:hypothetical protein
VSVGAYALSFRIPMRGPGQLVVPVGDFRCRPLRPGPGERPCVVDVDGLLVDLRISGTRWDGALSLCAELFVGRPHLARCHGEPRAARKLRTR